jgi:hypothetical protein
MVVIFTRDRTSTVVLDATPQRSCPVKQRIVSTSHAVQATPANQASGMVVTPFGEGRYIEFRRIAAYR